MLWRHNVAVAHLCLPPLLKVLEGINVQERRQGILILKAAEFSSWAVPVTTSVGRHRTVFLARVRAFGRGTHLKERVLPDDESLPDYWRPTGSSACTKAGVGSRNTRASKALRACQGARPGGLQPAGGASPARQAPGSSRAGPEGLRALGRCRSPRRRWRTRRPSGWRTGRGGGPLALPPCSGPTAAGSGGPAGRRAAAERM